MLAVVASACRIGFDDASIGSASDGAADAVPPTESQVVATGHGAAIVAGHPACAGAEPCIFSEPVMVTAQPGEGWELESFSAPCAGLTSCTVPLGTRLVVTFRRAPINANVIFITSTPAVLTGLADIDTHCVNLAAAAGLPGTFVAFVSTTTVNARDRVGAGRGWVRIDNLPVFDTMADLPDFSRNRGVARDELGGVHMGLVMTGSNGNGNVAPGLTCTDWTTTSGNVGGGQATWVGQYTTGFTGGPCTSKSVFFCIQTDRVMPVTLQPPAFPVGRYIFISAQPFAIGGGIAAADQQCADEASAAVLPGTYRALLSTTGESAADHIGGLAGIWRRSDGVVVTFDGLDAPALDAVITRDAAGVPHYDYNVFIGSDNLTALAGGGSCADWTADVGSPFVDVPLAGVLSVGSAPDCTTTPNRLFCAQVPD